MENYDLQFMKAAIELSLQGSRDNKGGPFGAIVVKNGEIVGRGFNMVSSCNDPTAHAEVVAIRDACKNLGGFQLDGCVIYTSCEPCPMCLGAIYWARPEKVYFGNSRQDAANIGFDDSMIYEELVKTFHERKIPLVQMDRDLALQAFKEWEQKNDKTAY